MKAALFSVSLVLTLSACTTVLGPENSVETSYTSSHSSEKTYRNMLSAMRDCYPARVTVEPAYFPEAKEGEIRLATRNESVTFEWLAATIKPAATGASVAVRRNVRFGQFDRAIPAWIEGDSRDCPSGTRPSTPASNTQN